MLLPSKKRPDCLSYPCLLLYVVWWICAGVMSGCRDESHIALEKAVRSYPIRSLYLSGSVIDWIPAAQERLKKSLEPYDPQEALQILVKMYEVSQDPLDKAQVLEAIRVLVETEVSIAGRAASLACRALMQEHEPLAFHAVRLLYAAGPAGRKHVGEVTRRAERAREPLLMDICYETLVRWGAGEVVLAHLQQPRPDPNKQEVYERWRDRMVAAMGACVINEEWHGDGMPDALAKRLLHLICLDENMFLPATATLVSMSTSHIVPEMKQVYQRPSSTRKKLVLAAAMLYLQPNQPLLRKDAPRLLHDYASQQHAGNGRNGGMDEVRFWLVSAAASRGDGVFLWEIWKAVSRYNKAEQARWLQEIVVTCKDGEEPTLLGGLLKKIPDSKLCKLLAVSPALRMEFKCWCGPDGPLPPRSGQKKRIYNLLQEHSSGNPLR